jgi:hypothetical protein
VIRRRQGFWNGLLGELWFRRKERLGCLARFRDPLAIIAARMHLLPVVYTIRPGKLAVRSIEKGFAKFSKPVPNDRPMSFQLSVFRRLARPDDAAIAWLAGRRGRVSPLAIVPAIAVMGVVRRKRHRSAARAEPGRPQPSAQFCRRALVDVHPAAIVR